MPMTITWREMIDIPEWRFLATPPAAGSAGVSLCSDLRDDAARVPYVYQFATAAILNRYNPINDGWSFLLTPAMAGTFGAGSACVFSPSKGPQGTVAAGCNTTTIVINTALPAAVGINQLANKGDGVGYKIRIMGNQGGGSGKTEETFITGNTGGTQPTITVSPALTFSPASGDRYELLSGSVLLLNAGTLAAGSWKAYDVACNVMRANLTQTNLPATVGTESSIICLDELYCPLGRKPGEGFLVGAGTYNNGLFNCLTATGIAAGTITGQAAAGDAAVLLNEYRNFQIRIVEDTGTPLAVGQRRRITSHTAGASPVYTLATTWTTTPSAGAKFVIENPNYVLRWGELTTTTYTYGILGDAWSTSTFAARGNVVAAGQTAFPSWGMAAQDTAKNARYSFIYAFRGGGVLLDVLDIAGGANGLWADGAAYGGQGTSLGIATTSEYDPMSNAGRYAYMILNASNLMYRFDVKTRVMEEYAQLPVGIQSSTAVAGGKMTAIASINDSTVVTKIFYLFNGVSYFSDTLLLR